MLSVPFFLLLSDFPAHPIVESFHGKNSISVVKLIFNAVSRDVGKYVEHFFSALLNFLTKRCRLSKSLEIAEDQAFYRDFTCIYVFCESMVRFDLVPAWIGLPNLASGRYGISLKTTSRALWNFPSLLRNFEYLYPKTWTLFALIHCVLPISHVNYSTTWTGQTK